MVRRLAGLLCGFALLATACSDSARLESGTLDELDSSTVEPAAPTTDATSGDDANPDEADEPPEAADNDDEVVATSEPDANEDSDEDPDDVDDVDDVDDDSDEDENNETESLDVDEDSGSDDNSDDEDEDLESESESESDEDSDEDSDDDSVETASGLGLDSPESGTVAQALGLDAAMAGDSGDKVLALQGRLAELGFGPGSPDGDYGRRTINAVMAFQDLVDLPATGDADTKTINALAIYRYDGLVLRAGDDGDDVQTLQQRLSDGPFDPGPIDGEYGTGTVQAVWALEKMAGIPVDGDWGPLDEKAWQRLEDGQVGNPEKDHDTRWVEVDLSEQLMKVYDPGSTTPVLVSHASSGSGIPWENEDHSGSSVTPKGDFHIDRRINGWRESSLNIGRLYNPLYFNGGIAFHGATSVPLYPASHGCIRLPMHIADYLPGELPNGTAVHILS